MPLNSKLKNRFYRRYWEFRAFFYALLYRIPLLSFFARGEHTSIKKLIDGLNPDSGCVLDLGCGVKAAESFGGKSTKIGLDWSLKMLFWAKQSNPGWRYIAGDSQALPLKDSSMAAVAAVGLSEYIDETEGWLQEIHRVLTKDGIFIFTSAPRHILNLLRGLWNPKLRLRSDDFWIEQCENMGFILRKRNKLTFQHQFLFIKTNQRYLNFAMNICHREHRDTQAKA